MAIKTGNVFLPIQKLKAEIGTQQILYYNLFLFTTKKFMVNQLNRQAVGNTHVLMVHTASLISLEVLI